MQGSFHPMLSPILAPNYQREIVLPFKKLPTAGIRGFNTIDIYQEQENLVFLYTNGRKNAVNYNIEKGEHREIKHSEYPEALREPIGIRIGQYFWIIGGEPPTPQNHMARFIGNFNSAGQINNNRTMLWSIRKQKWFNGPELPIDGTIIKFKFMCATSVGSNTVFIINAETTYSFNFETGFGKFHEPPPGLTIQSSMFPLYSSANQKILSCSCHSQKNYQRYVLMQTRNLRFRSSHEI